MSTATRIDRRRKPPPATPLTDAEVAATLAQWDPLAHKIARRWWRAYRAAAPYEDFHAEVRLAFLVAARKFDPGRGVLFSTYACWWARQQMQRFVGREVNRGVHVPEHHHRAAADKFVWLPVGSIEEVGAGRGIAGDDMLPGDRIPDRRTPDDPAPTDWGVLLAGLGARERLAVEARFRDGLTLEAVAGRIGGVSKERARQILLRAVRKLRERMAGAAGELGVGE